MDLDKIQVFRKRKFRGSGNIGNATVSLWEKSRLCEKQVWGTLNANQLESVFEFLTDGFWEWDVIRNLFNFNRRFGEILGYDPGELPENPIVWEKILHSDDAVEVGGVFNTLVDSGAEDIMVEVRLRSKNGNWKWLQLRGKVVERNHKGQAIRIIGTQTDVTYQKIIEDTLKENERRLMQQNEELITFNEELAEANTQMMEINRQLLAAKEKAIESDKLKSAFLANMSHEIRTPMNGIIGFANMLNEPDLPRESIHQFVEIINSSSYQLLAIIDDIIDFSKMEAGQVVILPTVVNLSKLLNEVHSVFNLLKYEGVFLNLKLPEFNDDIWIDGVRLRQILNNLLSNAVKFTVTGEINFGYTIVEDQLRFFVSDTGIGIRSEYHDKIFDRFFQVNTVENGKNSGTGLGLSISKAIVELMGGRIWLTSDGVNGSAFYFSVPLALVNEDVVDKTSANILKPFYDWSKKTILVAEDEELNYLLLEEILGELKCKIIWVNNGAEAVKACSENTEIDLVLMDLKMPILNGYEATMRIKKIRPLLPIVAQTAYALIEDRAKALEAGCNNYISKPINKTSMVEMVNFFFKKASE